MEANNMKAIRDALSDACYAMFNFLKTQNGGYEEMANALDKAKAALTEPPRNCDKGTAEEQAERYMNFCHNYPKCTGCPCVGRMQYHKCEFAWAQMPYKEGGSK